MNRLALALPALLLLATACGGGAGATPEDTWNAFQGAVKSENFGALYDLVAPADTAEIIAQQQQPHVAAMLGMEAEELKAMSPKDFFCAFMEKANEMDPSGLDEIKNAKFKEAKINGDTAEVTYVSGDSEETESFLRVDGKWYIRLQ